MVLVNDLNFTVAHLVCWEALIMLKRRGLFAQRAEKKVPRQEGKKERKQRKEESQESTGLFLGSVYS